MHDASSTPPEQSIDTNDPAGELNDGIDYIPVQVQADANTARVVKVENPEVLKQSKHSAHSSTQKADEDSTGEEQSPDQRVAIAGKDVLQQAIVKLLGLARREVLIVLPSMHELFDDARIGQGLLDFIKPSPRREVLMLLNSLADQQATTHQLIKLAQRISSRIQLKQASSLLEPPVMESDYLVVIDRTHILRIDDIDKYSGWFDVNFASRAQKYAGSLLQQWPKAREITEFRQFSL